VLWIALIYGIRRAKVIIPERGGKITFLNLVNAEIRWYASGNATGSYQ
jgi:hypothetical protein